MKKYIRTSAYSDAWTRLTSADQMAVEWAIQYYEGGQYNWEDSIRQAVADVNNGNAEAEYEGEAFYEAEADYDAVKDFIEMKYGVAL